MMLNIIEIIFLNLSIAVTCTGFIISNYEYILPAFVIKGYKYGSFAYQGSGGTALNDIEIPKAYYRHFYLFSSVLSVVTLCYMLSVYFLEFKVSTFIHRVLMLVLDQDRYSVSATAALIAMSLFTMQCLRRLYETHCLQVFAKSSKMNLIHYLIAMVYYFSCIIVLFGQAPLFCGYQSRGNIIWTDTYTTLISIPCILMFLWAWYEQYKSNVILANLRKDKKSGQVVTEDRSVPRGRMFEKLSSPHRMCEVIMYTALTLLVPTRTFFCIFIFVVGNQIQAASLAHDWYKKTFKNYPPDRKVIFPGVL